MANNNPYGYNGHRATLCFTCQTPSPTCPWKYNFTPVPGWDAEPTKIKLYEDKYSDSYLVKSCPLYEENKRVIKKNIIPEIPGLQSKFQKLRKRKEKS